MFIIIVVAGVCTIQTQIRCDLRPSLDICWSYWRTIISNNKIKEAALTTSVVLHEKRSFN